MELGIGDPGVTAAERETARTLWAHLECVHTLVYFAPAVHDVHDRLGLTSRPAAYTATRMLGAGPVTAGSAMAAMYGFSPTFVHAGLPAAWEVTTPVRLHEAVLHALDLTLAPLVAEVADDVRRAAELAREAAQLHPIVGRGLAASRAEVPWPDEPHLALWEAATRIREARGDGHHALAVAAGLDGCELHLTVTGDVPATRQVMLARRGWTEAEIDAAADRLRDRGLLDDDGALTDAGRSLRTVLEDGTDALAAPPWRSLGTDPTARLRADLGPIVARIVDAGVLPSVVTRRITG